MSMAYFVGRARLRPTLHAASQGRKAAADKPGDEVLARRMGEEVDASSELGKGVKAGAVAIGMLVPIWPMCSRELMAPLRPPCAKVASPCARGEKSIGESDGRPRGKKSGGCTVRSHGEMTTCGMGERRCGHTRRVRGRDVHDAQLSIKATQVVKGIGEWPSGA